VSIFHFLNVSDGDCSIIEHNDGKNTVIDVCNARAMASTQAASLSLNEVIAQKVANEQRKRPHVNYRQKDYPVNPIEYMLDHGITSVFRFILTHPDMDHMDGIQAFFDAFSPTNFWDTDNTADKDEFAGRYDEDDWDFYQWLRNPACASPKRLALYSGAKGKYYNQNDEGQGGGNGLHVLAPTSALVRAANASGDFNDCSYVILYRASGRRILFSGDSHDDTWQHILTHHSEDVSNIDLLIAPHHGRDSDRSYDFLDIVQPTMTYFGNAPHEHLAYDAWNFRGLPFITNNQANCMIVEISDQEMSHYVTNQSYAEDVYENTFYSEHHQAWYIGAIPE
jgi:beta-lactamase superfamily II metal-dependent hydrolase